MKTHANQRFEIVATSSKIPQIRNHKVYWKDEVVSFQDIRHLHAKNFERI